ncbi:MAG: hypothetical protein WC340_03770 [Kiritimatiellia bacterium]
MKLASRAPGVEVGCDYNFRPPHSGGHTESNTVYPPLCGGLLRSISAAMRWIIAKYIRRYAVDYCEVYPPLCGG